MPFFKPQGLTVAELISTIRQRPAICADVVLFNRKKRVLYLPERTRKPGEGGPWIIGGNAIAGETSLDTVLRHIKEDLKVLLVDVSKLFLLGKGIDLFWSYRHKESDEDDGESPRHDRTDVYALEITLAQLEQMQGVMPKSEYDGRLKAYTFADLEQMIANEVLPHPREILLDIWKEIFDPGKRIKRFIRNKLS